MFEKQIQRQIIDWLTLNKYFFWRNNTGMIFSEYKGKKRAFKMGQVGSPDIFVVDRTGCPCKSFGQIIGIEVKAENGKQSDNQKEWQKNFEAVGGIYIVARSLDDIIKRI